MAVGETYRIFIPALAGDAIINLGVLLCQFG